MKKNYVDVSAVELVKNKRTALLERGFVILKNEAEKQKFFDGKEIDDYVVRITFEKKGGR